MNHAWMQTYTGKAFYPLDPKPEDVDPVDIAHALGLICRYGGHVRRFYSVAEHSVLLSYALPPEYARWGLMHDATEAYMGDVIRPLKDFMPEYRAAEDTLMFIIADKYGLEPTTMPAIVKEYDARIILDEKEALMTAAPAPWTAVEHLKPLGVEVYGWSPGVAERRWLGRFQELFPGHIKPPAVTPSGQIPLFRD